MKAWGQQPTPQPTSAALFLQRFSNFLRNNWDELGLQGLDKVPIACLTR